ncbi:glutathione S-transferase family protein [Paraconexibacter antarcticus]|uniref:Glutathione S-transferase family protein n=1 Tax=Paraconexibacter antarcticus TaxID=2949664 RepID=A0ABY5DVZ6_9ACTN|nr:glutathione S-transferase family protein [Paraconexibacter antarcticus]UTI65831.1 glutathione S-transferase family protein [Paraconexibacter antarcticus]
MHLFHIPGSRSTRVVWALEEIGAPYDLTVLDRTQKQSEEHLARHPLGRVPVMELDDGQLMFESAAICLHLADLHPESGLLPPVGTSARALAYQWTLFAMTELEAKVFAFLFARRRGEDESEHAAELEPRAAAVRRAVSVHEWVAGDTFTVADIFCGTMLANAFKRKLLTEDGPLRAYADRVVARPAYARAEAAGRTD